MADLTRAELIERLGRGNGRSDNALDMAVEIALFEPDNDYKAVRPNGAGTKLIYTTRGGRDTTHLAWDWSMHPDRAVALLRALDAKEGRQG